LHSTLQSYLLENVIGTVLITARMSVYFIYATILC